MQNLVLFRGTKQKIIDKLNTIGPRSNCILEEFEDTLLGNDFGFNTNLGIDGHHYLDFEIYMLPTNKPNTFIITEINEF